jgi:hypothetical protein
MFFASGGSKGRSLAVRTLNEIMPAFSFTCPACCTFLILKIVVRLSSKMFFSGFGPLFFRFIFFTSPNHRSHLPVKRHAGRYDLTINNVSNGGRAKSVQKETIFLLHITDLSILSS